MQVREYDIAGVVRQGKNKCQGGIGVTLGEGWRGGHERKVLWDKSGRGE